MLAIDSKKPYMRFQWLKTQGFRKKNEVIGMVTKCIPQLSLADAFLINFEAMDMKNDVWGIRKEK
jgi:hypothetical protein